MFSLLESELSRCVLQAARIKIRPFSSCRPRARESSVSRTEPQGSRPCCSHQGGMVVGRDGVVVVGGVSFPRDSGRGLVLTSHRAGDLHPAARSLVRGHSSKVPPGNKSVPHGGAILPTSKGDMEAFMQARPFEEIPGPTAIHQSIPLAGTRLLYYPFTNYPAENMSNMLNKMQATYGPIMRVKFGNAWVVIIDSITDIENVVRAAEKEYGQPRVHIPESNGMMDRLKKRVANSALSWLGWGRVSHQPSGTLPPETSAGVPLWLEGSPQTQKLRADIAQHLNGQLTVASCLTKQEHLSDLLVSSMDQLQSNPKDMQTLFYRYAIESLSQMCYGKSLGLMDEPLLREAAQQRLVSSYRTVIKCLGETMTGARILNLLFEDPFVKRFKESKQVVNEWERSMLRESAVKDVREKGAQPQAAGDSSLLVTLMNDKALNKDEIFDAMHALMTIGSDSVASTLQMMLYALAMNADKQEILAAEIQNALGSDNKLTPAALESMEYLKASAKESLRLHFPMAAGGRVTLSKNIVLHDYLVPSGTPIVVNSRRTAQNPIWFDHPYFFRPERWMGEEAKKIPILAFMPFGFGANHCPSRAFSLQELNVAVVKILQKYQVSLPGEYLTKPVETVYSLFLTPKEALPFFLTPRAGGQTQTQTQKKKAEL